jgi:hypothetical protein
VAVDNTGVYFADGKRLLTCPLDGCTLAPQQVWSGTQVYQVTASDGIVAWAGSDRWKSLIQTCLAAACDPTTAASGALSGGATVVSVNTPRLVGRNLFYASKYFIASDRDCISCWKVADGGCSGTTSFSGRPPYASDGVSIASFSASMDAGAMFEVCSLSSNTCIPPFSMNGVGAITAANGLLFYALTGPFQARLIQACSTSGCTSRTTLADTPPKQDVVDIAADSSGVYWALGGDQGSIWMCPGTSCTGGARQIAGDQSNPFSLSLQGNFVYWGTMGLADGGGFLGPRRVAKPFIP